MVFLQDTDNDGVFDKRSVLAQETYLNHGLAVQWETGNTGFLYASHDEMVFRWPMSWLNGDLSVSSEQVETVVNNINADGNGGAPWGHSTRTLAFDGQGRLYISVGSYNNVDPDSFRSRIRRVSVSNSSIFPIDFTEAEVFADGLRNEVGLAFDMHGVLWGVENGADNLKREDLGGDIHNDNPVCRFKAKKASVSFITYTCLSLLMHFIRRKS